MSKKLNHARKLKPAIHVHEIGAIHPAHAEHLTGEHHVVVAVPKSSFDRFLDWCSGDSIGKRAHIIKNPQAAQPWHARLVSKNGEPVGHTENHASKQSLVDTLNNNFSQYEIVEDK